MQHEGAHIFDVDVLSGQRRTIGGRVDDARSVALIHANGRALRVVDTTTERIDDEIARVGNDIPVRPWDGAPSEQQFSVSVVICTLGDHELLPMAVQSVLDQRDVDYEVIVVDNAPASGKAVRALKNISDPRLRIVSCARPGLSHARNRGVLESRADLIAFTDDDAIADPRWLAELIAPLTADPEELIGATTGIVLPREMEHRAQRWFEARGGFPKDTEVRVWAYDAIPAEFEGWAQEVSGGPFYPLTTARVGAGVSMLFRRKVLQCVGPFDTALGAGTPTRGGEDLDMFARLLSAGWVVVHTPDAWTFHQHRVSEEALTKQIRGNGSGMAALLTKTVIEHPSSVLRLAARVPQVAQRLASRSERSTDADSDVPGGLTREEMKGFLEGPYLYLRSRAKAHMQMRKRRFD